MNKEKLFETGVRKTLNGHEPWFSVDQQSFGLGECEKEDGMTSQEYAKWYEDQLKTALNRLCAKSKPIEENGAVQVILNFIPYDFNKPECKPDEYGKYWVRRKDGKLHTETWNGSGWAYNHNSITHWAEMNLPF